MEPSWGGLGPSGAPGAPGAHGRTLAYAGALWRTWCTWRTWRAWRTCRTLAHTGAHGAHGALWRAWRTWRHLAHLVHLAHLAHLARLARLAHLAHLAHLARLAHLAHTGAHGMAHRAAPECMRKPIPWGPFGYFSAFLRPRHFWGRGFGLRGQRQNVCENRLPGARLDTFPASCAPAIFGGEDSGPEGSSRTYAKTDSLGPVWVLFLPLAPPPLLGGRSAASSGVSCRSDAAAGTASPHTPERV